MILDKDENRLKERLEKGTHNYYNALQQWQIPSKVHCISVEQLTEIGWSSIKWYSAINNALDYIFYRGILGDDETKYRIIDKTKDFNK